jgi:hypothetical protein
MTPCGDRDVDHRRERRSTPMAGLAGDCFGGGRASLGLCRGGLPMARKGCERIDGIDAEESGMPRREERPHANAFDVSIGDIEHGPNAPLRTCSS